MEVEWVADGWGVFFDAKINRWAVVFGDDECCVYSGTYPTRRRAKKEITHYIL